MIIHWFSLLSGLYVHMRGQRSIFDQNGWLNWFWWCIVKQKVFFYSSSQKHISPMIWVFAATSCTKKLFYYDTKNEATEEAVTFFFALYDLISTQFSFVTGQVFWIIFACLLFMCNLCNKVRTKLAYLDEGGKVKQKQKKVPIHC